MQVAQLRQVTDFLSRYQVAQLNPETLLLTSKTANFLVKAHRTQDHQQAVDILDKHLSLDPEYVCPLLHFEETEDEEEGRALRAVYQVDRLTLQHAIALRRETDDYFEESQLWILLSSVVNSLIYLQEQEVVYGVLSPNKIFVEDKIRVMDPTAFNLAPLALSRLSLHSPEIRIAHGQGEDLDFYQSDVYLLGLCMLAAAGLAELGNNAAEEELEALLAEVEQRYSSDLLHVLRYMLKTEPEERPTFHNIREFIETEIQIREAKVTKADPLSPDEEDSWLEDERWEEVDEQRVDLLEAEQGREEPNAYEQARQRYLFSACGKGLNEATNCASSLESIEQLDSIEFAHHLKKSNCFVEEFKLTHPHETVLKGKRRALQIKNRNSEVVRTVHSIMIPAQDDSQTHLQQEHPFTSPELMTMLKQETKRAREFFTAAHSLSRE